MAFQQGNIAWNKGTKGVCKSNCASFKNGNIPWNKGKEGVYSEEYLKKLKESHMGKLGLASSNWKGGISRAYKTGYYSVQYKEWRRKVFERDNYTCQDCGIHASKIGYLTAHHIKSWSEYPELRFENSNGITLCENCHSKIDKYRARFMNKEIN